MKILNLRNAALVVALAVAGSAAAATPYDRALYRHWIDVDRDCQDTRQEVLIAESLDPPVMDAEGCKVVSGRWYDPYTDTVFTDPGRLDIDHMIPLKEVHVSGGDQWDAERRKAYANDLDNEFTLIAVSASANRSKADKDPARWLPRHIAFRCEYVAQWVAVKEEWGLSQDRREAEAIAQMQARCPD